LSPSFLIGTDTRESCHRLKAAFVEGLTRAGVRVVDAGILPTAAVSFLIASKGFFAGGAMVSASHNPIEENGIKIFSHRGTKIDDYTEEFLESLFFGDEPLPFEIRPATITTEPDYARQYAHALAREYRDYEWSACRIVVDCANGAAYWVGPLVMNLLNLPHTLMNVSPDGLNINRRAGSEFVRCTPEWLAARVRQRDADVGIALDGDADRLILVDRDGLIYDGDMTLAILALKLQRERRLSQDTVVITTMSNSALPRYLRRHGIHTRMVRNGDKYVTQMLLEANLTLGGEEVGHIILHTDDAHVTGDGLRTALAVLGELTRWPDATLRDLAPGMRKWPQVKASVWIGRRTDVPADKIPGLRELLHRTREAIPDLTRLECRPASTEPVYRIMLESYKTSIEVLAQHVCRLAQPIQRHFGCEGRPIEIWNCVAGGRIPPMDSP
jgi:phosphoglucosamine mutase